MPSKRPRPLYDGGEEEQTRVGTVEIPKKSIRDRAYLIVLTGEGVGSMFRIEGESVIGRSASTTIRLNDDGVSRRHAKLTQQGTQIILEDLKSANGTFVNDEQVVGERILKDGDKIRIGSTTILKFSYHDDLEESFQQRMYEAALYDSLTKAFNKKHLLERLPSELAYAKRHNSPLSMLMFDVDHFKKVNDNYGHLAGDYVLARLGKITQSAIRSEDIFARYGGEEFSIVSRGVDLARSAVFAERLRTLVESTEFIHESTRIPVTISIGVAALPEIMVNEPLELIAAADSALYAAKRGGRNRVEIKR
jgi:diguanylate cyclase (GGDEF)-like protein